MAECSVPRCLDVFKCVDHIVYRMPDEGGKQTLKVGDRLFRILEELKDRGSLHTSELAEKLDLPNSTAHVYLNTLLESGFVVREDSEYRISQQFLKYGTIAREQVDIYIEATDKVDALAEKTGEKAWCIVEEGGHGVYLYGADGENAIQTKAFVGKHVELYMLAGGRAILAHLPENRRDKIIDRYDREDIIDTHAIRDELAEIREHGVAYNKEQHLQAVNAIGTAVTDNSGTVHGALSISGPAKRLTGEWYEDELAELLLGTANEIGVNLSYRNY